MNVADARPARHTAGQFSPSRAAEGGPAAPPAPRPRGGEPAPPRSRFEQLLGEMQAGSPAAAREIVETYGPHIRSAVKRRLIGSLRTMFDSEDFVQSAWKSLLAMAPEKLRDVRDPSQLVKLLVTIAARKIIDQYRYRTQNACDLNRRLGMNDSEVLTALARVAGINTPSQVYIAREKQELYRQRWEDLVHRQPPRNQRIIHLRLSGESFGAIAQVEEISERQARRVFQKLFQRLTGQEGR